MEGGGDINIGMKVRGWQGLFLHPGLKNFARHPGRGKGRDRE